MPHKTGRWVGGIAGKERKVWQRVCLLRRRRKKRGDYIGKGFKKDKPEGWGGFTAERRRIEGGEGRCTTQRDWSQKR